MNEGPQPRTRGAGQCLRCSVVQGWTQQVGDEIESDEMEGDPREVLVRAAERFTPSQLDQRRRRPHTRAVSPRPEGSRPRTSFSRDEVTMPPEPPESPGRRHRAALGLLVVAVAFGVALVVDLAVDGRWLDVLLLVGAAVLIGVSYRLQAYARERLVYRSPPPDRHG